MTRDLIEAAVAMVRTFGAERIDVGDFDDSMRMTKDALWQRCIEEKKPMPDDTFFGVKIGRTRYVVCNAVMEIDFDDESGRPIHRRNVDIHIGWVDGEVNDDHMYALPLGMTLTVLDPSLVVEILEVEKYE